MNSGVLPERVFGVVVGIEKYKAGPSWDLDGPAQDAIRFAKWLISRGVRPQHVFLFLSPLQRNEDAVATHNAALGLTSQPATRAAVDSVFSDHLSTVDGDYLFVFWGGHGVVTEGDEQRLFYADATASTKRNLDVPALLRMMRTTRLRGLRRQAIYIDACATFFADQEHVRALPRDSFAMGEEAGYVEQHALFAASPGELAWNDRGSGTFSSQLLDLLESPSQLFPPDQEALSGALKSSFERLSSTGRLSQNPHDLILINRGQKRRYRFGHAESGGENVPHQAPPLPTFHVVRSDVEQLVRSLCSDITHSPGVVAVTAIHGLPAVGKTTLAAGIAHSGEIRTRFPDGVLWATLGQRPDPLQQLNGWLRALTGQPFDLTSEAAAAGLLRTLLAQRAALIVIDDAWSAADVRPLLLGGSRCHVLVTTRRAQVADEIGAQLISLSVMSQVEALTLLRARLESDSEASDEAALLELAAGLGYHPMAMDLVAAMVARGYDSQEALRRVRVPIRTGPSAQPPSLLQSAVDLSVTWLRQRDRTAWEVFAWMGVLADDSNITAALIATLCGLSNEDASATLSTLVDDALLQRLPPGQSSSPGCMAALIGDLQTLGCRRTHRQS